MRIKCCNLTNFVIYYTWGFIIISRFNYNTSKVIYRLTLNIHYLCENYYTRAHMGGKKSFQ